MFDITAVFLVFIGSNIVFLSFFLLNRDKERNIYSMLITKKKHNTCKEEENESRLNNCWHFIKSAIY